ncbi:ribosomal protein S18-alanine N-acetyltransferase [Pseudothauera nasutitermitis]
MPVIDHAPMREDDLDWVEATEADLHAYPWSRGNFIDSLSAGQAVWVQRMDGQRSGYAVLLNVLDETHLLTLGIHRAMQGRGLGAALLDFLTGNARAGGSTQFFLEVRPSNQSAFALYRRTGFEQIGRRKGYYPAPGGREDAIVMRLAL